jgi:predicted nucleic acid-binding protein
MTPMPPDICFLLDTNVVIGILQARPESLALMAKHEATPGQSAVSQVTRIELMAFPKLTGTEATAVTAFLGTVTVIMLNEAIERDVIALLRWTRLSLPDAMVVATARVHGLTLLTLDRRLEAAMRVTLDR